MERIAHLDIAQNKAYIVNTTIVTRQRLNVIDGIVLQLEKNPKMKVEKRLVSEINFGKTKTLHDLVQQAEDELAKIEGKLQEQQQATSRE